MPSCLECGYWEPRSGRWDCPSGHGQLVKVSREQLADQMRRRRNLAILTSWGQFGSTAAAIESQEELDFLAVVERDCGIVGVDPEAGPDFECPRCGRWADVSEAAVA